MTISCCHPKAVVAVSAIYILACQLTPWMSELLSRSTKVVAAKFLKTLLLHL